MLSIMPYTDYIGLIGVAIILLVYYLLNIGRLHSASMVYLWSNLVGSLLILISLLNNWNLPSIIIEIAWSFISIIGIIRVTIRRQS